MNISKSHEHFVLISKQTFYLIHFHKMSCMAKIFAKHVTHVRNHESVLYMI